MTASNLTGAPAVYLSKGTIFTSVGKSRSKSTKFAQKQQQKQEQQSAAAAAAAAEAAVTTIQGTIEVAESPALEGRKQCNPAAREGGEEDVPRFQMQKQTLIKLSHNHRSALAKPRSMDLHLGVVGLGDEM